MAPWQAVGQRGAEGAGRERFGTGRGRRQPGRCRLQDRPEPSDAPAAVHTTEHAGKSSQEKRAEIAEWLGEKKLDAVVIAALDSLAWLFNIRGADVERTPVALGFALVHADGTADLFMAESKLPGEVRAHLGNAVRVHPREAFVPALGDLSGKRVGVDPERSVHAIFAALEAANAKIVELRDPCVLAKAVKNPVEQAGHRAAQARDGAALSRFLKWLGETARSEERV